MSLHPDHRAQLVLHVEDSSNTFPFSSAAPHSALGYVWDGSGLDWSGEQYVILRLRDTSSAQRVLQGRFVSPPGRHDGKKRIKVQVAFSEAPENVGADGVEVEGGEVTSVRPVGGDAPDGAGTRKGTRSVGGRNAGQQDREVVWEIEIEPDSDGDVTVSIEAGRPCDEEGAICHRGRAFAVGGHLDDGRGSGGGSAAADGELREHAGGA